MDYLIVRARLAHGYAASDPWSPSLDGLLGYLVVRERLGSEQAALDAAAGDLAPVEGLPLGIEYHGDTWWYRCSSPIGDAAARFRRYYHRRFDDTLAARYTTARKVAAQAGPYKPSRLNEIVVLVPELVWHAQGDGAEIERLLRRCTHIGRGVARGLGLVTEWIVAPAGDPHLARFHRPLPETFADAHEVTGTMMDWGIRPPVRLPANQALCVMPNAA